MARVVDGLGDKRVELFGLHAMVAQASVQAEASEKFANEENGVLIGLGIRRLHDVQSASDTNSAIKSGLAGGAELHAGNEAEGIGQAMMQTANGRERVCHRVHDAEVFLKGHGAHCSGNEHFAARVEIGAIVVSAR